MGSRKLVRDVLLSNQLHFLRQHQQAAGHMPLRLINTNRSLVNRQFSIFNEFSKQVKGEAKSNQEFQQSVKELNEKVGEIKEDLKARFQLMQRKRSQPPQKKSKRLWDLGRTNLQGQLVQQNLVQMRNFILRVEHRILRMQSPAISKRQLENLGPYLASSNLLFFLLLLSFLLPFKD